MEDVVAAQPTAAAHQPSSTVVSAAATVAAAAVASPAPPAPPKKSSTTLSVDRAAFLLLRVKKAFKRKRQHRKEKQAQALNAALNNQQGRASRGKVPPPLLRSRTLPAIIVPGIPVVSLHTDKTQFQWDERFSTSRASTFSGNRWSLLTRNTTTATTTPTSTSGSAPWSNNNNINNNNNSNFNNNNNTLSIKSLNLPKDDGTLVYRRKSSGSTPHGSGSGGIVGSTAGGGGGAGTTGNGCSSGSALQTPDASMSYGTAASMQVTATAADDFECYAADGSVLLRIPAPHVVAARAYRLASKKRSTSIFGSATGAGSSSSASSSAAADGNARSSGNNTPTLEGGCQIPGFSGCGSSGGSFYDPANTISGISSNSLTGASSSSSSTSTSNIAITRRLVKLLHQSSTSISSSSKSQQLQQQQQQQLHQQQLQQQQQYDMNTSGLSALEDAPRRLSWERRKDSSALQRSASIDSFAEVVWSDSPRPSLEIPRPVMAPFSKRPSASSLYSNCSTSSQSAQLNINELCVSGVGMAGAGGMSTVGGVGVCGSVSGMVGITASGNSRRESLLSPSSTRRNKLTRIINGK